MKKLLIIGHGRHGKDTAALYFSEKFGLKFESSSHAAAKIFIYDALKDLYGYKSFDECYDDRHNRRAEWYNLIKEYNADDRAKLAKAIMKNADCYVGMREREEILECRKQGIFDLIIWVDASDRLPLEDKSSFNIDRSIADFIIENNGTEDEFKNKLLTIGKVIFRKKSKSKMRELYESEGVMFSHQI